MATCIEALRLKADVLSSALRAADYKHRGWDNNVADEVSLLLAAAQVLFYHQKECPICK